MAVARGIFTQTTDAMGNSHIVFGDSFGNNFDLTNILSSAQLTADPENSGFHTYSTQPVAIGVGSIYDGEKALGISPAPGLSAGSAQTGSITQILVDGFYFGDVYHIVDTNRHFIVNVTLPNHYLYPGIVINEVFRDPNGMLYVQTFGVGTNDRAKILLLIHHPQPHLRHTNHEFC